MLAPATKLVICVLTNSVVATFLLLSVVGCVTAIKLPTTFKSLFILTSPITVKFCCKFELPLTSNVYNESVTPIVSLSLM